MTSRSKTLLVIGAIVVIVTFVVMILVFPFLFALSVPALIGMLFSEVVLFAGLIFLEQTSAHFDSVFTRAGFMTILFCGCAAEFATSLVFAFAPLVVAPWYAAIQLVILAFLVIGCGLVWLFGVYFKRNDTELFQKVVSTKSRADKLALIATECSDDQSKQNLMSLSDDIRYSDNTLNLPIDSSIDELINRIANNVDKKDQPDINATSNLISELNRLVKERQAEVWTLKRGGF